MPIVFLKLNETHVNSKKNHKIKPYVTTISHFYSFTVEPSVHVEEAAAEREGHLSLDAEAPRAALQVGERGVGEQQAALERDSA